MNKIITSALVAAGLMTATSAYSNSFKGVAIGITGAGTGITAEGQRTGGTTTNFSGAKAGAITMVPSVDLSYTFALSPKMSLGFGVDYIPAKADITSGSFTKRDTTADTDTQVSTTSNLTAEFKDHYTIYVQPTFVINKDSAFYGKIGYSQAKVTLPATIVGSTNGAGANVTETITNRSPDLEGMQYGLGLKTFLTNQAYVSIEASYTDYDTISTTTTGGDTTKTYRANLEAVQGRVTIGYQF